MEIRRTIAVRAIGGWLAVLCWGVGAAAQVPLDGFLPLVGIGLTDEYDRDNFDFFAAPSSSPASSRMLGPGSTVHYDVALLDTGAGFTLLTDQAFTEFGLDESYSGNSDGYRGTEVIQVGGATGQLFATVSDPFGLYASGLQDRASAGATLRMNNAALEGQTNTSTLRFPAGSPLPNVLGLPFASQYATQIRNDQPQVFELGGKTVRTPAIDFLPLGSQGAGITRKAQLFLNPGASFTSPPGYFPNVLGLSQGDPTQENPQFPTLTQGGLFVNATATNGGATLSQRQYFFDTGASVTVLSEFNALELGFDVTVDEPEFTISIVGSGGLLEDVPGFFVDRITIPALGGSITATNVPVLVLDVTDPSDAGNTVAGIIGTNILSGRNVVIDPNPSTGGGGPSAGLYVSDPVTTTSNWSTAAASAAWSTGSSWSPAATPTYLTLARVDPVGTVNQRAVVTGAQKAWDVVVAGAPNGATMTVEVGSGASLTTFSGSQVDAGGVLRLAGGALDTQYLDIRGGTLTGDGEVRTGSGPIVGQVEAVIGTIAPGVGVGQLVIDGRLSLGSGAVIEIELGGTSQNVLHDRLMVTGPAALGGELAVTLAAPLQLAVGDTFEIIAYEEFGGAFASIAPSADYPWRVEYTDTAVLLRVSVPGDFNGDGRVDTADYTVWRDNYGTVYDASHYMLWRDNFGVTLPPLASIAVPEPTAALLALIGALFGRRRR